MTARVGQGDSIVGSSAREEANSVFVAVRARDVSTGSGWIAPIGYPRTVVITLRDPLADRKVIDARTSRRMQDLAASLERREIGLVDKDSYGISDGVLELGWADGKGRHALSDFRGSTLVLLTRGPSYDQQSEAKMNMVTLESLLYRALDAERAKTFVFVIGFDRANSVAPDDDPFRPLFVDPNTVAPDALEILQSAGPPVIWFLAPDGRLRERIVGAATSEQVARALASAR